MMRSKASTVKILQQVHRRDFLGALEGDGPISSSMADVLVPEGMGARKLQPKSDAASLVGRSHGPCFCGSQRRTLFENRQNYFENIYKKFWFQKLYLNNLHYHRVH